MTIIDGDGPHEALRDRLQEAFGGAERVLCLQHVERQRRDGVRRVVERHINTTLPRRGPIGLADARELVEGRIIGGGHDEDRPRPLRLGLGAREHHGLGAFEEIPDAKHAAHLALALREDARVGVRGDGRDAPVERHEHVHLTVGRRQAQATPDLVEEIGIVTVLGHVAEQPVDGRDARVIADLARDRERGGLLLRLGAELLRDAYEHPVRRAFFARFDGTTDDVELGFVQEAVERLARGTVRIEHGGRLPHTILASPWPRDKIDEKRGRMRAMRILHTMLRVGDLDRSIAFYRDVLGMSLLRRNDYPEGKFTLAFLGYGQNPEHAEIELTHNWGVDKYELGNAYGHIALGVGDIYATCDAIRKAGGTITREPGPMKHGTTVIAFVQDPDGYKVELIEESSRQRS